jgi:hypothetical protein
MGTQIQYLNTVLLSLLGSDDLVERWWNSPNRAFSWMTPAEMYETDRHIVIKYILDQTNGDYS